MNALTEPFKYNINLLKIVGAWHSKSSFYSWYKYVLMFLTFVMYFSTMIEVSSTLLAGGFIQDIYTVFAEFESPVKLLLFRKNLAKIRGALKTLQDETLLRSEHRTILFKGSLIAKILQTSYYSLVCIALLMIILAPFLYSEQYKMFIIIWLPFDYRKDFLFKIVTIYVAFCSFCCAFINIGIDCFLYISCIMITAEYECLVHTLAELNPENFRDLIRVYAKTSEFVRLLQAGYNGIFTAQVAFSTLSLCVTLYQMSLENSVSTMLVSLVLFQVTVLFEIFCYCYFTQMVTNKSGEIFYAVFASKWYEGDVGFRRNILIFLGQVKEPVVFYACDILPINLESFKSILQKSWAFFIALKNMQDFRNF